MFFDTAREVLHDAKISNRRNLRTVRRDFALFVEFVGRAGYKTPQETDSDRMSRSRFQGCYQNCLGYQLYMPAYMLGHHCNARYMKSILDFENFQLF